MSNVSDTVMFRRSRWAGVGEDQVSKSTVKAVASMLFWTLIISYAAFCAVADTGRLNSTQGLLLLGEGTGPAS